MHSQEAQEMFFCSSRSTIVEMFIGIAPSSLVSFLATIFTTSMELTEVISSVAKEVTTRNCDVVGLRRVRHRIVRREKETLLREILERRGGCRRFDCGTISTISLNTTTTCTHSRYSRTRSG